MTASSAKHRRLITIWITAGFMEHDHLSRRFVELFFPPLLLCHFRYSVLSWSVIGCPAFYRTYGARSQSFLSLRLLPFVVRSSVCRCFVVNYSTFLCFVNFRFWFDCVSLCAYLLIAAVWTISLCLCLCVSLSVCPLSLSPVILFLSLILLQFFFLSPSYSLACLTRSLTATSTLIQVCL